MPPATFPLPKEGASGEEVLKSLGAHFKWHDEVTKALVTSSIESMDEFRYFFDDEAKIEPWVSKLNLGDQKQIQAARLRRAWASVRLFYQQSEQDQSQWPTSTLSFPKVSYAMPKFFFGGVTRCASQLKFIRPTPQSLGWRGRWRSACSAFLTCGRSRVCNSNSIARRRRGS